MPELLLDQTIVSDDTSPFVIAEIGHNHQGKIETALKLIAEAAASGASAAKFQKRENKTLFTPDYYNMPYISEHSFAETYGAHRQTLEFGVEEYKVCINEAKELGLTFFATAFDFASADFLNQLKVPIFKIASGDLQNLPLLKHVASFRKPMIISTGGSTLSMIDDAVTTIRKFHNQIVILQCTASYPADFDHLNLKFILRLREKYPDNIIGYSGHDNGIAMAVVAYTLGARVIEKHFTLNRTMKGTDHAFSLEPQGMYKMVRDLNRAKVAIGDGEKRIYDEEVAPIKKMGKMIIASRDLPAGHILVETDIEFRSPADGLPPSYSTQVLGKTLKFPVRQYAPLKLTDLR